MRTTSIRAAALALTVAVAVTACGDDDDGAATGDAANPGEPATHEVTADDYEFRDLPGSVAAGSRLELANASEVEVHELVAIRLPDGEERSVEEIMDLPEDELDEVLSEDEIAMVLLAPPASQGEAVLGDGTLDGPGRYLVLCFLPTGADPGEVMDAFERFDPEVDEAPPVPQTGPPHVVHGMLGELTVD
jgi:hypothetical protein